MEIIYSETYCAMCSDTLSIQDMTDICCECLECSEDLTTERIQNEFRRNSE